jgi:hypothetical protein
MSQPKIYPGGIRLFSKKANAPDFVMADAVINVDEFAKWLKENQQCITEYNGTRQLRLQILNGNKGPYMAVNTFQAKAETNDLPF